MAEYTIIADVSRKLAELLQEVLVPELISVKDGVALCSPAQKNDVSLGIYLFDIQESEEIRRNSMVSFGIDEKKYPPVFLNLFYMITAYSAGDMRFRMDVQQRILGRVIQYLHDYPIIPISSVSPADVSGIDLRIEMLRLDAEAKSRIWSFPGIPYQTSLFYRVAPAVIDSARIYKVERVRQVEINVGNTQEY